MDEGNKPIECASVRIRPRDGELADFTNVELTLLGSWCLVRDGLSVHCWSATNIHSITLTMPDPRRNAAE